MSGFTLFAQPWWVNLLFLVPVAAYFTIRKKGTILTKRRLLLAGIFGIAFGFVETAVVVYLRAASGLPSGYGETLSTELPNALAAIEPLREAATIVMLAAAALLVGRGVRDRLMAFFWMFAFWDISYYFWLWYLVKWPTSLLTPDVLFLIPVPWLSQVWFPILVSGATILVIAMAKRRKE